MNRIKQPLQAKGMSPTEPARRLNTASLYADNRLQPTVTLLHRIADILHFNCTKMSKSTG